MHLIDCCRARGVTPQTGKAMKLTLILLTIACLQAGAKGVAQNNVTYSGKNVKLETVFKAIKDQTGFSFFYNVADLERATTVSVELTNIPLEEALTIILKNQPLSFSINGKTIVIKEKPRPAADIEMENSPTTTDAPPPIDIKGRILDESGEPVEGVSVIVKGSNKGTTTNAGGYFELKEVDDNAVLIITGVNVNRQEINVSGRTNILIAATMRVTGLSDVVVNKGYYTESRKLSTGSVGTITAREIERQPVSNPLQAIQGKVPGILIRQQTGVPGGGFDVTIRGRNSLINGNDPLYIIDGVPYPSQAAVTQGTTSTSNAIGGGVPSALNLINPSDIESIDILKDADATAIYGSRGANGVVLITTKKGRAGAMNVDLNVYSGFGEVAHKSKLLNSQQYVDYRKEAIANSGATISTTDYDVNGAWDQSRYTNWQDVFYGGTTNYTNAQLSFSGGTGQLRYLVSGNYFRETHIAPGDFGFKKGSMHLNLSSATANQRLKVQFTADYSSATNHTPYTDLQNVSRALPLLPPVYNELGNLSWQSGGGSFTNPFGDLEVKSKIYSNYFLGSTKLSYRFLKILEFEVTGGYNKLNANDVQGFPTTYYNPSFNVTTGSSFFGYNTITTMNFEPQLNVNKSFGNAGTISGFVAFTLLNTKTDGFKINGTGYTDNSLLENLAGAATITRSATANAEYKYNAVFGRLNYNLHDKYVLNLTARRDGSSRFGPGKQFANFYAIAGAWIFSREKFLSGFDALNFAKLRASYGTSGSDQVGDYKFWDLYTFTNFSNPYQGSQGLFPSGLFNPELGWESNKKAEVGLEFSLWNDMISSSVSYYSNRSTNQLVVIPLAFTTGFNGINGNLPATVQNSGWEFTLRTNLVRKAEFNWIASFNLTLPKNKLIDFPGLSSSTYATRFTIGEPITSSKAYLYTGVSPQTGLYTFRSAANGRDTSNPVTADRTELRNTEPVLYGEFGNNFHFGNFELDFSFYFVKQTGRSNLFLNSILPGYFLGSQYLNWPVEILDNRWRKPGDVATIQRYAAGSSALGAPQTAYAAASGSTFAYVDASYVRLRNASLAYNFPTSSLKKIRMKRLKIFIEGQNLFTITDYKGDDPENQGRSLAPLRVVTAGVNVGL